jgi:hypothetical protein
MSIMKNLSLFLLVVMIGVGCATNEEQARTDIQGTWKIDLVTENGQDVTSAYMSTRVNYRITFDGDNGFIEIYQQFVGGDNVVINGSWDFSDKATQLILTDNNQSRVFSIDKLDEDELNLTDQGSNDNRKLQLIPS